MSVALARSSDIDADEQPLQAELAELMKAYDTFENPSEHEALEALLRG